MGECIPMRNHVQGLARCFPFLTIISRPAAFFGTNLDLVASILVIFCLLFPFLGQILATFFCLRVLIAVYQAVFWLDFLRKDFIIILPIVQFARCVAIVSHPVLWHAGTVFPMDQRARTGYAFWLGLHGQS